MHACVGDVALNECGNMRSRASESFQILTGHAFLFACECACARLYVRAGDGLPVGPGMKRRVLFRLPLSLCASIEKSMQLVCSNSQRPREHQHYTSLAAPASVLPRPPRRSGARKWGSDGARLRRGRRAERFTQSDGQLSPQAQSRRLGRARGMETVTRLCPCQVSLCSAVTRMQYT